MPVGRPSAYTPELAIEICEAIAASDKGLEHVCAADERFPSATTVYNWLIKHDGFLESYLRARVMQSHLLMDQCVGIADDGTRDDKIISHGEGDETIVANSEWISRSKLRVDTRFRMAGKLNPKHYGDKLDVTSDGEKIGLAETVAIRRAQVSNGNEA